MIKTSFADIMHCAEAAGFKVNHKQRTIKSTEADITEELTKLIALLDKQYSACVEACVCPNNDSVREDLRRAGSLEAFEKWWTRDEFDHEIHSGSTKLVDFSNDTPMKYYTRLAWEAARRHYQSKGGSDDLEST